MRPKLKDFGLPNHLRRHLVNLSATIQVLVGEIILSVEGLQAEASRKAATELETALRNKRATEQLHKQLTEYLQHHQLPTEDAAIAFSASAGRSTAEIAKFYGFEQNYVRRRLCAIRKSAAKWQAPVEQMELFDGGEVLELFAEAQRR